ALARFRVGRAAADRAGAGGSESRGRGDEVRHQPRGPAALPRALRRRPGPDDDATRNRRSRVLAFVLPSTSAARGITRAPRAVDGHEPGLQGGCGRGSDPDPRRLDPLWGVTFRARCASQTFGTRLLYTSVS